MEKPPSRWGKYYENTKLKPPHESLVKADQLVPNKGKALDFGAGALNDRKYLLDTGFGHVVAVDGEPSVKDLSKEIESELYNRPFY